MKAPATSKNKLTKKKYEANEDTEFLESLKEPNREYTKEELDELEKRAEIHKEELKLNMAADLLNPSGERQTLDNINLVSREEFLDYSFRLYNRLELLAKSEFYLEFLEHLLNGLTKPLSSENIKRLSATLQATQLRRQNDEREKKAKAKPKKANKPQLKTVKNNDYDSFSGGGIASADVDPEYDEDNDFM